MEDLKITDQIAMWKMTEVYTEQAQYPAITSVE